MFAKTKKYLDLKFAISIGSIFFLICLLLSLHRYYSFYTTYDQGIFNQLFWNSIHGNFFESSLSSGLSTNVIHNHQAPEVFYRHLGQHFNPIFLLWMPIYAIFPFNESLIFLQVSLVTGAGLVLYALARHYLKPSIAIMITISFYCAACVNGPTLANFHDISSAPLLIFSVLLAMEKKKWYLFWLFALLLLGVRQDTGLVLIGIGVYMTASKRHPLIGIALCMTAITYIGLVTTQIMPLFSADVSKRMTIERFGHFASSSEASTVEIIWDIIKNPFRLVAEVFYGFDRKFAYLIVHFISLGFVSIVSPPTWLISGIPLLYLFLQREGSALVISIRYAMPVVSGIFYGAILWWSTHQSLFKKVKIRRYWKFCMGLSLAISLLANPNGTFYFLFPDNLNPLIYFPLNRQWEHIEKFGPLINQISPEATVSATNELLPQLSNRRGIVRLPELEIKNDKKEVVNVDYVIADLWRLGKLQLAFESDRKMFFDTLKMIDQTTINKEYGIIGFEDGVILMKKASVSNSQVMINWLLFRNQFE
jgi:uncharacterized membrane protein